MKQWILKIVPRAKREQALTNYHRFLAWAGAHLYRFPSKEVVVIGVTGTKGKTTTVELINSILETAGYKTAIISTLRFKIGNTSHRNMLKMTMPGRFFIQQKMREAVTAGCTHVVLEMTSQGTLQFRHTYIDLDALVLTNIAPEHIESHGSFEKYVDAKVAIARALAASTKKRKVLVVNSESPEVEKFLAVKNVEKITYAEGDARELGLKTELPGAFNQANAAGAATVCGALGIPLEIIQQGIANCTAVAGRMESVLLPDVSLPFSVIVDYAHTPESLQAVYSTFPGRRKLCVLGGTGGGRDKWKRPLMGAIADEECSKIYLTDEDPYNERPEDIVDEIASGIKKTQYEIIMDRRLAIRRALQEAHTGDIILITGKGTDPYIMGPDDTKTPWSDSGVSREEIMKELARRRLA